MRFLRAFPGCLAIALSLAGCPTPRTHGRPPAFLSDAQLHDGATIDAAALPTWTKAPTADLREELVVSIRDDVSGRGFEGRGALVVRPGHALRMILLGPGGTTAMDVWMREGRWRVSIPALDRVVRGDPSTPRSALRGLPIPLLSRWLVAPFGGELVVARGGKVRDDGSVVDDATLGPGGARSFVVFSKREGVLEVRARSVSASRIESHAWWIDHGEATAWLDGEELPLGDVIVPASATYVSTDPAMTVQVTASNAALVDPSAPLPEATFADPDHP